MVKEMEREREPVKVLERVRALGMVRVKGPGRG